jgi:hypothetical protein
MTLLSVSLPAGKTTWTDSFSSRASKHNTAGPTPQRYYRISRRRELLPPTISVFEIDDFLGRRMAADHSRITISR